MNTEERIASGRVIAIMRGDFGGREEEVVEVLAAAGVTAVEVTLNSPDALRTIARLARRFGARLAVGAGTVMTADEVAGAAGAGAQFVVSPNRQRGVIEATKRLGLTSLPGCYTPSEIVEALEAGADAVKLFPASALGPGYVRALRGPLPEVRVAPTGGVTPEAAREYASAGAWAVGVGSELFDRDALAARDDEWLRDRAAAFVAAMRRETGAGAR
jgi:2-dehydro-3-deoxyphosphogluconate aldolase/(4S)-4-hydroxy-2-oxoglutarate aldolase